MKAFCKSTFYFRLLIAGFVFVLRGYVTGQTFSILHVFTRDTNADVAPNGELILSGNTLYGTTFGSGSIEPGIGTVFAINTDGTGFTNLFTFDGGPAGAHPTSGLILSGDNLYGTALTGDISENGAVFGVLTNGSGAVVVYDFTHTLNPPAT